MKECDYANGKRVIIARNECKGGPAKMAPVKISLPQRLEFGQEGDSEERWKLYKQRWTNYTVIAELETSKKKPIFFHCLADMH